MSRETFPSSAQDMVAAAADPLVPEPILRALARLDTYNINLALVTNPALPLDLLNSFVTLSRVELAIKAIPHPLITFDQVRHATQRHVTKFHPSLNADYLNECKTVGELIDYVATTEGPLENLPAFFRVLICSPFFNAEEFMDRVFSLNLSLYGMFLSDARFDLNYIDYEFCSDSVMLSLVQNPTLSEHFILNLLTLIDTKGYAAEELFYHPNFPIELSAEYHAAKLDTYQWRPSVTTMLESKCNTRLALFDNYDTWAELPLAWKLKMAGQ